jgi:chromosome segregation ATPase
LADEKFEKDRALEEKDILTTNIKRMRNAIDGVTEENDGLRQELESARAEIARLNNELANRPNELNFYKDQFARLAAENDELKRALDKAMAQLHNISRTTTPATIPESTTRPDVYDHQNDRHGLSNAVRK